MAVTGFRMDGTITSRDMRARIATLSSIDRDLVAEWKQVMASDVIGPMVAELGRLAPAGRKGDAAARSIRGVKGQYPAIVAGKGSWVGDHGRPWQPFFAMEFGMNRGAYTTYLRRRRNGRGQVVTRRRVRTWALPARRRAGYWLDPGFRRMLPRYRTIIVDRLDRFVVDRLGG